MNGVFLTLLGLWVLLGALWLAVYPVLSGGKDRVAAATVERNDLEAEKARLIGEIHDLELDRVTGKLSEEDYRELQARLKSRAVEVMRALDRGGRAPLNK